MEVPILNHGPYLIGSVQSALTDADFLRLRDGLVEKVGRFHCLGVIVDVTATDVVDSFAARTLVDIARMVRLRGAKMILVGIQADVAVSMVRLGVTLDGVDTALDLDAGVTLLDLMTGESGRAVSSGTR
ncbi:MAG TPA: STAS domain-containing protein [Candidatus Krumholzibacteria bacterium]|nr:STAS domain-containing protein [Candidatus Krumholzibacteria bacterium]